MRDKHDVIIGNLGPRNRRKRRARVEKLARCKMANKRKQVSGQGLWTNLGRSSFNKKQSILLYLCRKSSTIVKLPPLFDSVGDQLFLFTGAVVWEARGPNKVRIVKNCRVVQTSQNYRACAHINYRTMKMDERKFKRGGWSKQVRAQSKH